MIRIGNMKDKIPDNVGSVVNHLQIRTDVQNITALAVRLSHRWKAWEIDVVDVCNGDKNSLNILQSSSQFRFKYLAKVTENLVYSNIDLL